MKTHLHIWPWVCLSTVSLTGAEGEGLRPIRGAIGRPLWETPLPYIIITALAVISLLAFFYARKRLKKSAPSQPTAYESALAQLQQARTLMQEKKDKAFSSVVSNAIRHYIEKRFAINAPEQTTEEFLAAASQHPLLKGEAFAQLSQFLQLCDVVKFAQQSFGASEREAQYQCAEQFLNESEKVLEEQTHNPQTTAALEPNPSLKPT